MGWMQVTSEFSLEEWRTRDTQDPKKSHFTPTFYTIPVQQVADFSDIPKMQE